MSWVKKVVVDYIGLAIRMVNGLYFFFSIKGFKFCMFFNILYCIFIFNKMNLVYLKI